MKNLNTLVPALIVLLFVSLSCSFLKNKFSQSGGEHARLFTKVAQLPPIDMKAPLVSPGAVAVRELAKLDPSVASFADLIESSERGAMKKVISTIPASNEGGKNQKVSASVSSEKGVSIPPITGRPLGSAQSLLMLQSGELALPGIGDGVFVGSFAGGLKAMLAEVDGTFNQKNSKTETIDGTTTVMDMEMSQDANGSSAFGMGLKTESVKNGAKVSTELKAKIEGNDCPNAEGQVQITVKMHLSAQSGSSAYAQDITAFIRIVVNDNAEIGTATTDFTQGTSRSKSGRDVYVETGETVKFTGLWQNAVKSNERVVQKTDNATAEDISDASGSGMSAPYGAAIGAIYTAQSAWTGGGCMKIEAKSPGTVEPASGIEIPVKVMHRKDGTEVGAKLSVTLSGETSIDPTFIPKTPGTLMYIAPSETGKNATIKLKATSRRGIATLDLNASTGTNAYRISGGLDDWQTDTIVCDITKPFTLTGGAFTMKLSGGISGTYEYSGPFNAHGTGTYEMSFPYGAGKNGEMVGRGAGTITGGGKVYTGAGEERYSLMTVDGACVDGPAK